MLDIFSGLRLVVKRRSINIDNAIFRCHWFFTSTLLVSFSLIITARQYVGQPIECHSVDKIPDSLLNSYCWVQSTFTVPQACSNQQYGIEVPYPCIDNTRGREIKIYAYYQWVGIVLFIQGLLFHLPYYLWKLWENGLIKAITGGLRVAVLNEQERAKKKEIVVEYIHDHLGCHKRYALKYFLCEFICLINLLSQLWATNRFFDGQFLRYGLEVLEYSSSSISSQFNSMQTISSNSIHYKDQQSTYTNQAQAHAKLNNTINLEHQQQQQQYTTLPQVDLEVGQRSLTHAQQAASMVRQQQQNQVDPMTYIFPRMTKCSYFDFGSSGDVQKHDALCLLPLNIINEKIYIALWFWFLILAILTVLVIIYRLFAIGSENVRCKGLISRCKLSSEQDIRLICQQCDVGDWFLFYMVAENLDPLIMREIVAAIATKIAEHLDIKRRLKDQLQQETDEEAESDNSTKHRHLILMDERDRRRQQHLVARYTSGETDDAESVSASRRNTLVVVDDPTEPMIVKKIKKRLYNKRLWSIDLGSGGDSARQQQLAGQSPQSHSHSHATYHQEARANSNRRLPLPPPPPPPLQLQMSQESATLSPGCDSTPRTPPLSSAFNYASAPPASEMPLNSAPLWPLHRRGSLTRKTSTSSSGVSSVVGSSDAFVMEMSTISGSSPCLDEFTSAANHHVAPTRWRKVNNDHVS